MDNQMIIERLKDALEIMGLSQTDAANRIGVRQQNLSLILNGKRPFGKNMQHRVESMLGISVNWLLTGEGAMLNENNSEDLRPVEESTQNYRLVPLINIDSVGGMDSSNAIDVSEQYIIKMMPFTEAREGDVAILQSGNSMWPTIPSGAALLIRQVVDWKEYFGYGGIFVLWLRDGRRITKEIRRFDPDPQNYVWCVSYNPDIADEELPKSMIRGVWKVIKYIADFGW